MACRVGGGSEKLDTLFPSWNGFLVQRCEGANGYDMGILP